MNFSPEQLDRLARGERPEVVLATSPVNQIDVFDDLETKERHANALSFLRQLFEPTDTVCLWLIHQNSKKQEWFIHPFEQIAEPRTFAQLDEKQMEGWNVYVCMSPLKPGSESRRKDAVADIRTAYLDIDKDGKQRIAEINKAVETGDVPTPTFIVSSSPEKYQVIWRVTGLYRDQQEQLNKRLVSRFGGDSAATDCVRVLRLPGFTNLKYGSQPVVQILKRNEGQATLDQFKIANGTANVEKDYEQVDCTVDGPEIPYGKHDITLTKICGKLHYKYRDKSIDELGDLLIDICEHRCENYGSDYREMCRKIAQSIGSKKDPDEQLFINGRLAGTPAPQPTITTPAAPVAETNWRNAFDSIEEMESGPVTMLIDSFLQADSSTFIGGSPGEGKTLLGLSITKALTTGKNLFGRSEFAVPKIVPVIYLIPESGARAFRNRCEAFHIPHDPKLFLCRTISKGPTLNLDDPSLLEAVKTMRPVVILDTLIRFSEAKDENAASQNKQLVDAIIQLRQAGSPCVIALHHATKDIRTKGLLLESILRGTGDIAAHPDTVYGLLRDAKLYRNGNGPSEIDVVCAKARDFDPPIPFRLAATYKKLDVALPVSHINETGDFKLVECSEKLRRDAGSIVQMVISEPMISVDALAEASGLTEHFIRKTLRERGWHRVKGGPDGGSPWHRDDETGGSCPYRKTGKAKVGTIDLNK